MTSEVQASLQKRKRNNSGSDPQTPSKTRLKTQNLVHRPIFDDGDEQQSPRTAVSERMGHLVLETHSHTHNNVDPARNESLALEFAANFGQNNVYPFDGNTRFEASPTPQKKVAKGASVSADQVMSAMPEPFPVSASAVAPLASQSQSTAASSVSRDPETDEPRVTHARSPAKRSPRKPSGGKDTSGKALNAGQGSKSRKRASPPPTTIINDLVWTDAEITGHDPDPNDPDDDLYGINGVGFKPTREMAETRRAQRRKQVADWKRREEGDRRARRREARNHQYTVNDSLQQVASSPDADVKRVRFSEAAE